MEGSYDRVAHHGGGAFFGKDATRVERCAAHAARRVARTVFATGTARRCEVHVAYAIAVAKPLAVDVEPFAPGPSPTERSALRS